MEGAYDIPVDSIASAAEMENPLNHSSTDQSPITTNSVNSNNQVKSNENETVSPRSPSISDIEDGQILESSSECSDLIEDREKCSLKRSSSPSFLERWNERRR